MKFCSLGSSSSGNCNYIGTENINILIDGGFSGKKIEEHLWKIGVEGKDIDGILVTHEHIDHIRGVGVLSRRYDIPIYANQGTWLGMEDKIGKLEDKNIKLIESEEYFNLKDLDIYPVKLYHDAREPVGYTVSKNDKKISIITDTGKLDDRIMLAIEDSDLYLLESNHDIQMLRNGSYPYSIKERVLGDFGHLSNNHTSEHLARLIRAKGEVVLLGHLSQDNNTPRKAFNETAFALMDLGVDIKKDITLGLTYRDKITDLYDI